MTLLTTIIDCHVSFPLIGDGPVSLLTLPLGTGTFLDYLARRLDPLGRLAPMVIPEFEASPGYADALASSTGVRVQMVTAAELASRLSECETSDYLLIVEPRNWPMAGYELEEVIAQEREYRGATHAVGVGADVHGTRELVECESGGRVKRVQRFYNLANWPEAASHAISYSLVPAKAAAEVEFRSLRDLRAKLAGRGALSRDLPLVSDVVDLADEGQFLAVQERVLNEALAAKVPAEFRQVDDEILIGPGCNVDPSARLIPPVLLQAGVNVEAGATIIGPALVGPRSRIERGAVLAHSVVLPGSTVSAGAAIRHRVVAGRVAPSAAGLLPEAEEMEFRVPPSVNGNGRRHAVEGVVDTDASPRRRLHLAIKRMTDVALTSAALLTLSPLLALVAVLVKLASEGPVFFRHQREGLGGREFNCLKFRTMARDAHRQQRDLYAQNEVDGPQFKMRKDPRVTRLGRWLRATNIDELPQLINVLRGDMSLVGPRPSPFRENQICVPWRRARLSVRPGITGLWQLCRGDDSGNFHEWIYYDILYVRNFTVWLDMKIVVATILTLGGQRNVPVSWLVPWKQLGPYQRREVGEDVLA